MGSDGTVRLTHEELKEKALEFLQAQEGQDSSEMIAENLATFVENMIMLESEARQALRASWGRNEAQYVHVDLHLPMHAPIRIVKDSFIVNLLDYFRFWKMDRDMRKEARARAKAAREYQKAYREKWGMPPGRYGGRY